MQYLNEQGLNTLWAKIVASFQAKNQNLTSILSLTASSGFLRKTAEGQWTLDSSSFATSGSLQQHTGATNNPHSVTKAQVGLSNLTNDAQVKRSEMGVANGVATLGSDGKVPSSQLPSFVDDVIEGYLSGGSFYRESSHTTLITGESGKIYVDLTSAKTYRWSGTAFSVISETLALGETSSTAYAGNKGKANADNITTLLSYFSSGIAKNALRLSNTQAIGATNKPVYFTENGVPAAISYTIGRNVAAGEDVTPYTAGDSINISSHVVKVSMTAVTDPSSNGAALSFIDSITQNTAGRISATKKQMREASATQSGIITTLDQNLAGNKSLAGSFTASGNIQSIAGGVSAGGIADFSIFGSSGGSVSQLLTDWNSTTADDMALSATLGVALYNGKADKLSITPGTAGSSTNSSGTSIVIPFVTVNQQGLVTNFGTRTHTLSGLLTTLGTNSTNAITMTVAGETKNITASSLKASLGLGSFAYKSSLAFSALTSLPSSLSGYGITDCQLSTTVASQVITAFELTIGQNTVTVGAISDATINALSL